MSQKIDMVDGLIGKRAAVMGKGAAPGRQIVVALRAAPSQAHGNRLYFAKLTLPERRANAIDSLVVPVLKNGKDSDLG